MRHRRLPDSATTILVAYSLSRAGNGLCSPAGHMRVPCHSCILQYGYPCTVIPIEPKQTNELWCDDVHAVNGSDITADGYDRADRLDIWCQCTYSHSDGKKCGVWQNVTLQECCWPTASMGGTTTDASDHCDMAIPWTCIPSSSTPTIERSLFVIRLRWPVSVGPHCGSACALVRAPAPISR